MRVDFGGQSICVPKKLYLSSPELVSRLIYKDESWNYIQGLDLILRSVRKKNNYLPFDNHCKNSKVDFWDDSFRVNAVLKKNNWVYLLLNNQFKNTYELNFDLAIDTVFHEFQIAFKHHSIAERYRFRVTDNLNLDFEVVGKGAFFHKVSSTPLSFIPGNWYKIRLIIFQNIYQFCVDNRVIMTVRDHKPWFNGGDLAIIFYDWDGKSEINARIRHPEMYGD